MLRIRSFRRRIFLAILAAAVVPAALTVAAGTALLSTLGSRTGTLGPWEAVASSGRALMDAARDAAPADSTVALAAERHGEALSASVQQSRLYTVLTTRLIDLLPWAALAATLVLVGLSAWMARALSRSLSGPIGELVGWTGRIARGEMLPERADHGSGVREFDALRSALRTMSHELRRAQEREVEAARLRAWTEMARRVAHELKNPLTPMRMSAATLGRSDDPGTREAAEILLEEVGRLDEMARTFSQFGRMPEGPPAEVDLTELLEGLVARHDGQPVPVALRVDRTPPLVEGHLDVLTRALRNLIVNAQEAVQESRGTGVEVTLGTTNEGARVVISDDGPGIDPALLDRIWLPDVTTKRRGTGLGLALVRQAVEAHGGRVEASNRPDGGAAFTLDLPREMRPPSPAAAVDPGSADSDPDASERPPWTS